MKPGAYIAQAERDAKVIEALHVARYALVTHDSLTVRCEGGEWEMDFSGQIAQLTEAMELMGVDMSQPLLAPMRPSDEA